MTDLLPSEIANEDDPSLQRPDTDDVQDTIEKTRQALEKLTNSKISAAMPVRAAPKQVNPSSVSNLLHFTQNLAYFMRDTLSII